jgi:hypothetical protein
VRIFSEEEYFEILLERAAAICSHVQRERDRCASLCESYAGPEGLVASSGTPREALLNAAAWIRSGEPCGKTGGKNGSDTKTRNR